MVMCSPSHIETTTELHLVVRRRLLCKRFIPNRNKILLNTNKLLLTQVISALSGMVMQSPCEN